MHHAAGFCRLDSRLQGALRRSRAGELPFLMRPVIQRSRGVLYHRARGRRQSVAEDLAERIAVHVLLKMHGGAVERAMQDEAVRGEIPEESFRRRRPGRPKRPDAPAHDLLDAQALLLPEKEEQYLALVLGQALHQGPEIRGLARVVARALEQAPPPDLVGLVEQER